MDTTSGTATLELLEPTIRADSPAVRAPRRPAAAGPRVEFVALSTRWREHRQFATAVDPDGHREQVLDGLSLTLPAGRITVLLGAHGAGKTLLACHLLGLAAPDSGAVLIDGRSVWELPERARAELLTGVGVLRGGIRIQQSAVLDSHTVADNLRLRLTRCTTNAEQLESRLRDYLDRFELTTVADQLPTTLDPAARRRLALGLALAADPPLVVIDDPGQALDLHHYQRMCTAITAWQARTGATMLITLRSLEVARRLADQVVVLRDGRVLSCGGPEALLAGVADDDDFERRFGTNLGGYAEADPERTRRRQRANVRVDNRRHLRLVMAYLVLGLTTLVMLLAGTIANPG